VQVPSNNNNKLDSTDNHTKDTTTTTNNSREVNSRVVHIPKVDTDQIHIKTDRLVFVMVGFIFIKKDFL